MTPIQIILLVLAMYTIGGILGFIIARTWRNPK